MKLSQEVFKTLEGCEWIERFTNSQIIYTYKFKIHAVEEYLRGISPEEIFKEAGIPLELLKKDYARNCLKRWVKQYKEHGLEALKEDKRGTAKGPLKGRPKKNKDKLTYAELEAIVKIQTEVIETLKKRKALAQRK
ncbi:helix-turn-helix domain containing protein [Bdellovibrio sp. HCB-110]|uniref:helix-turn-helix domain containing protein n=1 Tax=Bdellovibrio sp. HCB-110 TaxID=3391182 RepID=UPI0039B6BFFA